MPDLKTHSGASIHYEISESPGRPWIVLLNGMTQSTAHWKSHIRALGEHVNVLSYDARGQGQSPIGDSKPTLRGHAADLEDLLESLQINDPILVGFSHGARVALQHAVDFDRASALVLTSATARPTALAKTIIQSWRKVLELGGIEAMSWCAIPDILGAQYLEDNQRLIAGIAKASVQRNDPNGVSALLDGMLEYPDLASLAEQVSVPTLCISADEDLLVTKSGAQELASLCGGNHVEVVGCGHTIPIEKPEEFRSLVLEFISQQENP